MRGAPYSLGDIAIPDGPHLTPAILASIKAGTYERPESRAIRAGLTRDDVVLEIGGGLGYTSALCARIVGGARVHVYEADPRLESPIRELYRLNDVDPDLHMCALGPREATEELNVAHDFWESSLLTGGPGATGRRRVPVRAFDEEVAHHDPPPTFLIIDIEGAEYDLLRRASLRGFTRVVCEVHPDRLGRWRVRALRLILILRGFARRTDLSSSRVWYLERRHRLPRILRKGSDSALATR